MRYRVRYSKFGKVRFTSHRDVARIWERVIRRADLPIVYTEGFSPRPKLHFGLALSTGHESWGEYLDIDLSEEVDVDHLPDRLTPLLPEGMAVDAAAPVVPGQPSLQEAVTSCTWRVTVGGEERQNIEIRVAELLAAESLPVTRERKGKQVQDDLRPLLRTLVVIGDHPLGVELEAELGTQPRALRPNELVAVLGSRAEERRVVRMNQWMSLEDDRREPLEPADSPPPTGLPVPGRELRDGPLAPIASRAAHAEARAS